jgi:hypothetical protein
MGQFKIYISSHKKQRPFNKTTSLFLQFRQMMAAFFFGAPFKNHKYARGEKNVQPFNRQVV